MQFYLLILLAMDSHIDWAIGLLAIANLLHASYSHQPRVWEIYTC